MSKVTCFPASSMQRLRNRLGKTSAPCVVSERWLRFQPESKQVGADDFMTVDVMSGSLGARSAKLCQLIVTRDDLQRALRNVRTIKDSAGVE
jgi:hypothetical protein